MVTLYFKVIIQSNYLIKYLLVAVVLSAISSQFDALKSLLPPQTNKQTYNIYIHTRKIIYIYIYIYIYVFFIHTFQTPVSCHIQVNCHIND